ncbi:MAG: gliding motility lipoprotein GldH [Tannerella sp.]|jgi:gliding motility-associated lipoprotein GldH|nr:gliding motility lipoprotein GldH [Tannerella sp.]
MKTVKHLSHNRIIPIIIASCFCFSCGRDTVYNRFQPIRDKAWDKQSEYYFKFEIKDCTIPYHLKIQVRNSDLYPYQNLWLLCKQEQPDSTFVTDTLECLLADDFGKWLGNGITLYQSEFSLRNHYYFPDTGTYTLNLRHGMRDDLLKGIEDIGLLIEKN